MWYLFFEIWLWLLFAFGLGWVMCWMLYFKADKDETAQLSSDDDSASNTTDPLK